jgi:hypothetical protein
MDANLDHLLTEVKNNDSWIKGDSKQKALKQGNPNISSTALALGYQDFTKSTESPYDLACVFVFYRERCYVSLYGSATERQNLCKKRGGYAEKWYTFLGGKGSFGMGIQFPARLEVGTFNEDIAKTGEAAPDYIKNFYKNPKGNYSDSTYGIPNNKQGTKPTKTFGNCTAYAYGRFWEIADCAKSLTGKESQPANVLSGNAGEWYTKNQAQRVIDFETSYKLRNFMEYSVNNETSNANPSNTTAAGKTSTAQTGIFDEDGDEVLQAWFTGYFPSDNPKYIVTVLVENGKTGNASAAPVFKDIAEKITILRKEQIAERVY